MIERRDIREKLAYLITLITNHAVWCPKCGPNRATCPALDRLMRDEEKVYRFVSGVPEA